MQSIDTVIFDMGGVLTDYSPQTYFQRKGFSDELARKLLPVTFESPYWGGIDRGVLTTEQMLDGFIRSAPDEEAAIRAAFRDFRGVVTRRETAIPWIEEMKAAGYRVYVLSNSSEGVVRDCAEALDFLEHVDGVYWSFVHKVVKPERPIYLDMLYEFGVDPARAVFVDDGQRNLDTAASLGIHTVLYRTQEQAERELRALLRAGAPEAGI